MRKMIKHIFYKSLKQQDEIDIFKESNKPKNPDKKN